MIMVKKFSKRVKRHRNILSLLLSNFTDNCLAEMNDSAHIVDWRDPEKFNDILKYDFCIFNDQIPVGIFQCNNTSTHNHHEKGMGFWISPEHRSQGHARNALKYMVIKFKDKTIKIGCWSHNIASKKIILENDFIKDYSKYIETPYIQGTALYFTKYAK